jgi:hypothetical protein
MKTLRAHLASLTVAAACVVAIPAFASYSAERPSPGAPVHDREGASHLKIDRTGTIDTHAWRVNVAGGDMPDSWELARDRHGSPTRSRTYRNVLPGSSDRSVPATTPPRSVCRPPHLIPGQWAHCSRSRAT